MKIRLNIWRHKNTALLFQGKSSVVMQAIDAMKEWGSQVIEPDYTQGLSSTSIQKKIADQAIKNAGIKQYHLNCYCIMRMLTGSRARSSSSGASPHESSPNPPPAGQRSP